MDEALIKRAQSGDRAALEQVLEEVAPLVQRFGLRMCRHEADAEDVVQDTLLSVARHLGEFEGRASLSSWVFTQARTACGRRRRGLKNQAHAAEDAARDAQISRDTPEDAASDGELRAALSTAISSLSDEQREVLLLRDMEGLSAPEVAEATGLSIEAVKSRLHRARAALRESLRSVLEPNAPLPRAGCPDVLAAFSRKLEGDLGSADCAAMEEHVAKCPACSRSCDALHSALGACRAEATAHVSRGARASVERALRTLYPAS